jgi:hypothetical protein
MLNRIRIQGYKSLRDVEVRLKPLSVLSGPNAGGKSNFLDALQLLSKIVTSRRLKDAFEPPYRGKPLESFSFGSDGLKGLLAQDALSFSLEVDFELSDAVVDAVNRQVRELKRSTDSKREQGETEPCQAPVRERQLRYRIQIEMLPRSGILRVADEYLAALDSKGEATGKREPFLTRKDNRLHLCLEPQAHPTSITASCPCRTMRPTTRIWLRPGWSSKAGCSFTSSPANGCVPRIQSRRFGISVSWARSYQPT